MPIAHGYWLDDHTFIAPAVDKDGVISWVKLTTYAPRDEDGNVKYDPITGKLFDLEIIDPDDFEWKGMRLKLCTSDQL